MQEIFTLSNNGQYYPTAGTSFYGASTSVGGDTYRAIRIFGAPKYAHAFVLAAGSVFTIPTGGRQKAGFAHVAAAAFIGSVTARFHGMFFIDPSTIEMINGLNMSTTNATGYLSFFQDSNHVLYLANNYDYPLSIVFEITWFPG